MAGTPAKSESVETERYVIIPMQLLSDMEISSSAKLVWAAIRDRIGRNRSAWPSALTVGKDCGLPRRTVQRAIDEIIASGWLRKVSRGAGHSCKYDLPKRRQIGATAAPKQRQNGARVAPNWRSGQRQNGAQNHPNRTTPKEPKKKALRFPPILDTEKFRVAWAEWVAHRKEKHKTLTASTAQKQLTALEKKGHDEAIAAIDLAITSGWTGVVFPENRRGQYPANPKSRASRIEPTPGEYKNVKTYRADGAPND